MEVKEMTIADVLKTPAFYNNLKSGYFRFGKHPEKCKNKRKRPIKTTPDRPFAGTRSF